MVKKSENVEIVESPEVESKGKNRERIRVFGDTVGIQFRKKVNGQRIIRRSIEWNDESSGIVRWKNRNWIVEKGLDPHDSNLPVIVRELESADSTESE